MQTPRPNRMPTIDGLVEGCVPGFAELDPADRQRLQEIAAQLHQRGMPVPFIASSLRSTAGVLREIREESERTDNVLQRESVRRFIEQNAVPDSTGHFRYPRRERKREERDRLHVYTTRLLRDARQARGRHEVKKTRSMLLKLDQRELRRVLGREGDDLCRQINVWLRSTAAMF